MVESYTVIEQLLDEVVQNIIELRDNDRYFISILAVLLMSSRCQNSLTARGTDLPFQRKGMVAIMHEQNTTCNKTLNCGNFSFNLCTIIPELVYYHT